MYQEIYIDTSILFMNIPLEIDFRVTKIHTFEL